MLLLKDKSFRKRFLFHGLFSSLNLAKRCEIAMKIIQIIYI